MEIIKIQKENGNRRLPAQIGGAIDEFQIFEKQTSISHLAKVGVLNKKSKLYRKKCIESTFYPFSIALSAGIKRDQDGRCSSSSLSNYSSKKSS